MSDGSKTSKQTVSSASNIVNIGPGRVLTRRALVQATLATAALPLATPAIAQSWPSKPIRVICGFPAGGLVDAFARYYGEYIAKQLGQPVVVDNKAGASGSIAALEVKNAAASGYTILVATYSTLITNKVLQKNLPYDADKDFTLLSAMPGGGLPLVVRPDTKSRNLQEFVNFARANHVNIGSFGIGGTSHIVIEELNKQYGLSMDAVQYRGEAPMWADMAAGTLHGAIGSWGPGQSVLATGKGVAIAVTEGKRLSRLPDVGTFTEQGATSQAFLLRSYSCAVAPAGIPEEIARRYSDLFVAGGKSERIRQFLDNYGIDDAATSRGEFQSLYDDQAPIWLKLAADLGLKPS